MLQGGCHCGQVQLGFDTGLAPDATSPRACNCSFCVAHGAAWLSDAQGGLRVRVLRGGSLARYRQGSGSAQFLLCRDCGVLVAVVFEDAGILCGAVNVRCLARADEFAATTPVSPMQLPAAARRERWRSLWIPRVRIEGG